MDMNRFAGTFLVGGVLLIVGGSGASAQSTADSSKEWPTYGHDPGGMRFSPLTQLTPANVSQLKVAWVYHMRPAGAVAPAARGAAGPEAEGLPPQLGGGGRGRGGRGGSGFRASEVTPLVIGGTMYLSTPYSRVVAVEPSTGKEIWTFTLPSGGASTRGVEYWPGDAQMPPQVVFGSSRWQVVLAECEDRKAQ